MRRLELERGYVPNAFAILSDRPVRREPAHTRDVINRHPRPLVLIEECGANLILTFDIGLIVGKQKVRIVVEQTVSQRAEQITVTARELAGENTVDDLAQGGVRLVDVVWW